MGPITPTKGTRRVLEEEANDSIRYGTEPEGSKYAIVKYFRKNSPRMTVPRPEGSKDPNSIGF